MTNRPTRNANLDLLRIISTLLIILLHSIVHSGVLEQEELSSVPIQLWIRFTYMLTQVCVNCYVLISGYFLVKSKFRLQKLVVLWLEVVFYSFSIKLIFMITGYIPFSSVSLLSCLLPVVTGRYWFITIYFGLYLLFPFLNILISAMNKRQHTTLNIVLFILLSVLVSIYPGFSGMNSGNGWGLAWFVVLYFAAAWVRLYYEPRKTYYIWIWIGLSAIVAVLYVLVGSRFNLAKSIIGNMYRYDSVLSYLCSISLLLTFISIKVKALWINRFITFIAPTTLGVYLIHDHPDLSSWMWNVLNVPQYMNGLSFPVVQLGIIVFIFAFCTVIDIIRRYTVGRVDKIFLLSSIQEKIDHIM